MPDFRNSNAPGGYTSGSVLASNGRGDVRSQATEDFVGRMPPFNEEAEQAVLAGIILYKSVREEIFSRVSVDDFHVPRNALVFQAAYDLHHAQAPVEPESLAEKLRSEKRLDEAGGLEYLARIYSMRVLGANASFYATMVRNKSVQRQLINACASIMSECYETPYDQVPAALDMAGHAIADIADKGVDAHELKAVASIREELFEYMRTLAVSSETLTGVDTGYPDLNRMTGGLQDSDLIIIAARPSMGKTAFALNLAYNAAKKGKNVAFFSLEMSAQQLVMRLLSVATEVPLSKLRQPHGLDDKEWANLITASGELSCPLFIDDTPGVRVIDIRAKAKRLKTKVGVDMIVIDYLQLMRPSRPMNSRELEISEISRSLKGLAKEFNIPVVALSQLNRKLEDRSDKRPQLADLRESGAIEQDADVIMFVYRDDVYRKAEEKKKKKKSGEDEDGQSSSYSSGNDFDGAVLASLDDRKEVSPTEILIGKQRNGPVGTVNLIYRCKYTSFVSAEANVTPSEEKKF